MAEGILCATWQSRKQIQATTENEIQMKHGMSHTTWCDAGKSDVLTLEHVRLDGSKLEAVCLTTTIILRHSLNIEAEDLLVSPVLTK